MRGKENMVVSGGWQPARRRIARAPDVCTESTPRR
jgi:hypothetical protein